MTHVPDEDADQPTSARCPHPHGITAGTARRGDGRIRRRPPHRARVACCGAWTRYDPHRVILFTASPDQPDFTHLVEQAGWPTTETWTTRPYDPLLESLRPGQQWQFRLTANPVRSGRRAGWTDTKPLGHVTVKQQEQWLLDRAANAGFRLVPRQDATLPTRTSTSPSSTDPSVGSVEATAKSRSPSQHSKATSK